MSTRIIIDTDIIIDYLRGQKAAITYLEGLKNPIALSVITVAELYAGVKGKKESDALDEFTSAFEIIPVTAEIAVSGGNIRNKYGKSHGVNLADALIASTVVLSKSTLATLNKKHYPMLAKLICPYRK